MEVPDFRRAEYVEPRVIEGYGSRPLRPVDQGAFAKALVFGLVGAVVGCAGYALVGFTGWMVSIVAIGVGWLIAKSMMTGSGGVGGKNYQVAAAVLTYFAVSVGELVDVLHRNEIPLALVGRLPPGFLLQRVLAGPLLALRSPLNGGIGLVILFFGMQAAWRLAAGSPGFAQGGNGPRVGPFGVR